MRNLFYVLAALILGCPGLAGAANVKVSKDAPIQFFLVERVKQGEIAQVSFTPQTEKAILRALTNAGFNVQSDDEAPMVSKTRLKYSEIHTEGAMSSTFIGYVHFRTGVDGSINYTTGNGKRVVLQTDVNEVSWVLDKKQAFAMARKAGAKYVLLADVILEEVDSPGAAQKTFNVSLDASLHNAANGRVVKSYGDSLTRMGPTAAAAAKDAAAYLGKKLVQELNPEPQEQTEK